MKAAEFDYVRAGSVAEACAALADGADAKIVAGGQTLVPMMAMRLARPALLVDINHIAELTGITATPDGLAVRAGTRQAAALASPVVREHAPLLAKALAFVGHAQTRNRGTVGGSLVHGDPSAEIPLVAVALGATLRLVRTGGERAVAAADFFEAPMFTVAAPDELLLEAVFPVWTGGRVGAGFQEVAARHGDFAAASAAVQVVIDAGGVCRRIAVAAGAVGPVPLRLPTVEAALTGTRLADAEITQAAALAAEAVEPDSDMHASAGWRRRVTPGLVARAIAEARDMAAGGIPGAEEPHP